MSKLFFGQPFYGADRPVYSNDFIVFFLAKSAIMGVFVLWKLLFLVIGMGQLEKGQLLFAGQINAQIVKSIAPGPIWVAVPGKIRTGFGANCQWL